MTLTLRGPAALGPISQISLNIEDDHTWRAGANPLPGGPTSEELAEQIWGPYRFVPGTGPGVNSLAGVLGASRTGRDITVSRQLKIGDPIPFALEPTRPGRWMTGTTQEDWQRERGRVVRLTAECITHTSGAGSTTASARRRATQWRWLSSTPICPTRRSSRAVVGLA